MTIRVVDTNVIAVANRLHNGVCAACVESCVKALIELHRGGRVALDDAWQILREYQGYANSNRQKEVGDVFIKWILQNLANGARCALVHIEPHDGRGFESFPDEPRLAAFDGADRKFVAVSAAHPEHPPILQATDSKWLDWLGALKDHGIEVLLLCDDDIRRFRAHKVAP
jgi:hypothetical protein